MKQIVVFLLCISLVGCTASKAEEPIIKDEVVEAVEVEEEIPEKIACPVANYDEVEVGNTGVYLKFKKNRNFNVYKSYYPYIRFEQSSENALAVYIVVCDEENYSLTDLYKIGSIAVIEKDGCYEYTENPDRHENVSCSSFVEVRDGQYLITHWMLPYTGGIGECSHLETDEEKTTCFLMNSLYTTLVDYRCLTCDELDKKYGLPFLEEIIVESNSLE